LREKHCITKRIKYHGHGRISGVDDTVARKISTWESGLTLHALCSRLPPSTIVSIDSWASWPPRDPRRTLHAHGPRRPGNAHRTCRLKETSLTRTFEEHVCTFLTAASRSRNVHVSIRSYAPGPPVIPAGPAEPGLPGNPLNPGGPVFPLSPGWPSRPGKPLGPSLP
jgi:hypothetical protein